MTTTTPKLIFELKVRDIPGVLVRIAHAFARRGYNIRALHVVPIDDSHWSLMTIVALDAPRLTEMGGVLEKLIDVLSVTVREEADEPQK
jgi:acetolactate synthase small subunit